MDKLKNYFDYSLERALKTCAQVALATIGVTCLLYTSPSPRDS